MIDCYAVKNNNEKIRLDSSSGGAFSAFCSTFDVVYGVSMSEDGKGAEFVRVTKDIERIRGSKYLQAHMGDIYNKVKEDIIHKREVLFSGTACQVNGLYAFLGYAPINLYTVDIICHGVPSPILWEKYTNNTIIEHVNFRSKKVSWEEYGIEINGDYISRHNNKYMKLYLTNLPIRPSCYNCVCKESKHSDITIGDFWGIDNVAPDLNDKKGTSIVILRTEKGRELFERIKDLLTVFEVNYQDSIKYNPCEYESVAEPINREQFFRDIKVLSFDELCKKYLKEKTLIKILKRIIRTIRRGLNG